MKKKYLFLLIGLIVLFFVIIKSISLAKQLYHYTFEYFETTVNDSIQTSIQELYKQPIEINHYDFDYSWLDNNITVMHAMGGIDDNRYTNSLEAFLLNYEKGNRVFEVDLDLTDDFELVCSHDADRWRELSGVEESTEYSYLNFKNTKLFGKYTTLDIEDLMNLMSKYDDIVIITDTKDYDKDKVYVMFQKIINSANKINPENLNRIVPQIYKDYMLEDIMELYPFESVLFTLYLTDWSPEYVARFCHDSGIGLITVYWRDIDDKTVKLWKSFDINIAIHTINDLDEAKDYIKSGFSLVYTDFISNNELKGD